MNTKPVHSIIVHIWKIVVSTWHWDLQTYSMSCLGFWSLIQHNLTPRRKSQRLILMDNYSTIPLQHAAPTVDTLASILLVFALLMERLLHWLCKFRATYVTLVLRSTTKINWLISHHHILEAQMAILKECPMFKQTHIHCSLVNSLFLTYSCWIPISDGEIMLNPLFLMVKYGVISPPGTGRKPLL